MKVEKLNERRKVYFKNNGGEKLRCFITGCKNEPVEIHK